MKKIPTLFERRFVNNKIVEVLPIVTPGMEWVLEGEGIATIKYDGSCCAIINGVFYKRFDAKNGKPIPENAIKCQEEADPVTGHLPCWVPVDFDNPADRWFFAAREWAEANAWTYNEPIVDGTYEAIGPHFQGNPYHCSSDRLLRHGENEIYLERTFEGIRDVLKHTHIEGIVFWKDGQPQCKIKRTDFGFKWPM